MFKHNYALSFLLTSRQQKLKARELFISKNKDVGDILYPTFYLVNPMHYQIKSVLRVKLVTVSLFVPQLFQVFDRYLLPADPILVGGWGFKVRC